MKHFSLMAALVALGTGLYVATSEAQTNYSVKEQQVREVVRNNPDAIVDWLKTQTLQVQQSAYQYLVKAPSAAEQLSKLRTIRDTLATMNDGSDWVVAALAQVETKIAAVEAKLEGPG